MNRIVGRRLLILACISSFTYYLTAMFYETKYGELEYDAQGFLRPSFIRDNATFCNLPNLEPLDKSVLEFVVKEPEVDCTTNGDAVYKRLFKIDTQGKLTRIGSLMDFGNRVCCFKSFDPQSPPWYSRDCVRINGDQKLPEVTEFIGIFCQERSLFDWWKEENDSGYTLVDLLHFTPLKSSTEDRVTEIQRQRSKNNDTQQEPQVSVVIFGMDAVSHLNFQRTMPETRSYLLNTMSAKFLNGYTKVADNTFPNMMPALAGQSESELQESCWPSKSESYFDNCRFIWKEFEEAGYRSAYSEDAIHISIFNYERRGFESQPTDYFLNDFMRTADSHIGHWSFSSSKICYGPRLAFSILLENMEKLKIQMGQNRPYFHFTWSTSISHDRLNSPGLSDAEMHSTLKSLYEKGEFNNTVLILMSDHGARSGKIRETFQGKVEESMPFLYAVFPPWFMETYPTAISNFVGNQQMLTTHFDTYEMLKDLVNLTGIRDEEIEIRQDMMENATLPRGISPFLQIPNSRNCEEASIPKSYCMCHGMSPISIDTPDIVSVVDVAVDWLNILLTPFPQCSGLKLFQIEAGYKVELRETENDLVGLKPLEYAVRFKTNPGGALFEATLSATQDKGKEGAVAEWEVVGDISRVNIYGNQSHCVNDYSMKKFCYCQQGMTARPRS